MDMLLKLPVSISNWIILEDALRVSTDRRLFIKAFHDYADILPVFKVSEICVEAQYDLLEADFQCVLDMMWKCIASTAFFDEVVKCF